jgi:hypothetical protein
MTSSSGEREALRLERAVEAFVVRIRSVPADRLTQAPAPGEWTLKELAAHSAEIYGYWAKQLVYLRANPGQAFGRTAADPDRIRFVDVHRADTLDSLIDQIRAGSGEAATALRAFTDDEWKTTTGLHSARGQMDMDFIAQLFVAGHAEEHLDQLEETLAKIEA